MLNGFVSLSGDNCPPTPIKILRDTGASQSLILADISVQESLGWSSKISWLVFQNQFSLIKGQILCLVYSNRLCMN